MCILKSLQGKRLAMSQIIRYIPSSLDEKYRVIIG
jgi:hypothetical protein